MTIPERIFDLLTKQNKKQTDLATAIFVVNSQNTTVAVDRSNANVSTGENSIVGYSTLPLTDKIKYRKPTHEQLNFIEVMRKHGALAGVCYSVEDVKTLLKQN